MKNSVVEQNDQNRAIGYLKVTLTLMMIAFHSVLAYSLYIPSQSHSSLRESIWSTGGVPIVDSQGWGGFYWYSGFFDDFAMALFFFISGLFVWKSLLRKGSSAFLRDRFLRLGLPFAVLIFLAAPAAYYPTYLLTDGIHSFADFFGQIFQKGWLIGPLWFIWLLLAFDCVAVLVFALVQKRSRSSVSVKPGIIDRPASLFGLMVALSAAAYVPLALAFGMTIWTGVGPFGFQTSRIFHYGVYFLAGIIIGNYGIEQGLLASDGKLARRWPLWFIAGFVFFLVLAMFYVLSSMPKGLSSAGKILMAFSYVLCSAALGFAFLGLFMKHARFKSRIMDSLQKNAYGMYLIHYGFVTWLQYSLLAVQLSAIAKASIVFFSTVLLTWGIIAALRRIPVVSRIV